MNDYEAEPLQHVVGGVSSGKRSVGEALGSMTKYEQQGRCGIAFGGALVSLFLFSCGARTELTLDGAETSFAVRVAVRGSVVVQRGGDDESDEAMVRGQRVRWRQLDPWERLRTDRF